MAAMHEPRGFYEMYVMCVYEGVTLKLNEKAVTFLNDIWDKVWGNTTLRNMIESKCEL